MRNTLLLEHSLYGNESTSSNFLARKGKDISQIIKGSSPKWNLLDPLTELDCVGE